jgi:predicted lipoprotein with Yx(FWY)xxD motif
VSRHRIALALAAGAASTLLLAACGSSADSSADTGGAAPAAGVGSTAPVNGGATAAAGNGGSGDMVSTNMLMAKQMSGMGTVVTDAKGWTLYRYAKDQVNMSMCTDSCAQTWMPVMADGSVQGMGVQAKIGTVTRNDGMKQVTLAGWPLYRYMGDTKAGDMNGQGKNGAWSLVTPAGKMMAMSDGAPSSPANGSGASPSMSGMSGM